MSDNLVGATTAVFVVSLSVALTEPVDVAWSTKDGTAKAGTDYEAANGVVTFLPGELSKQIEVTVYGQDGNTVGDKNFYIALTPPTNAILSGSLIECIITVTDDEGTPVTSVVVAQGKRGLKGDPGLSAYEQAVFMGYEGTVEQWMEEEVSASAAAARADAFAAEAAASAVIASSASSDVENAKNDAIAQIDEVASTVTALNAGQEYFSTQTELLAAKPSVAKKAAKALDTKKVFMWTRTSGEGVTPVTGTWTDTGKSEFDLSKDFTNEALPIEIIANLYNPLNNTVNINIDPLTGTLRTVSAAQVNVFPVVAGEKYTLKTVGFNTTYAILAVSPNNGVAVGKTNTLVPLVADVDADTKTFVAPISGFALLNVKWVPNLDVTTTLTISSTQEKVVRKIRGVRVYDENAQTRIAAIEALDSVSGADLDVTVPNIYSTANNVAGFFLGNTGILTANSGGVLTKIPIKKNTTYLFKAPQFMSSRYVGLSSTDTVTNGKVVQNIALSLISPTVCQFTTPDDDTLLYAFYTVRLDLQTYNVIDTLEVYEGAIPSDTSPFFTKIKGYDVRDPLAQKRLDDIGSQLKGKSWAVIGDSISAPYNATTNNWAEFKYHDNIASLVEGMTIYNKAVSGFGYQHFTTIGTTMTENPDYITVLLGTNDFGASAKPLGTYGSVDNTTVSGCINLTLTSLIQNKMQSKLGVILPLPRFNSYGESGGSVNQHGVALRDIVAMIIRYCKDYGIPYLDLYSGSNIYVYNSEFRAIAITDGVHPNILGHLIITRKIKAFMESL